MGCGLRAFLGDSRVNARIIVLCNYCGVIVYVWVGLYGGELCEFVVEVAGCVGEV